MTIADWVRDFFRVTDVAILGYFLVINTSYLVLIVLAAAEFVRHLRHQSFAGLEEMYRSPLTPGVSVLVPAHNEEANIVASVQGMLALRYPQFEVIVVDDGSTDATFERLEAEFDLVLVPRVVPAEVPTVGTVLGVYVPRLRPEPLMVVRKENGGKTDALNTGINLAQQPLICMVDADSILDPQALLSVAKPFADDPLRTVATGGVVRVANGCKVIAGRIVEVGMPAPWLVRIQVVEYLRAFLLGRTGWSRIGGLLIISGAFGMFRRDLVVEVGGLDHNTIGEDAELVVRLHRHLRRTRRDYRVVFVAEPVSWSEAPSTARVLSRQRRRWHRGITEILWKHRSMIGNPRYGRIGLLAMPYYVFFELLAPMIELAGLVMVPLGLAIGAVNVPFAIRFLLVAYGYALVVNLIALAVEEFTFARYPRWKDLAVATAASALENLGFRQLTALWRVMGTWAALRRTRQVWGVMTRTGFDWCTVDAMHVILSCAMSLDGYIDDDSDERLILSGPADLDRVDALRASCDAILVGAGTIRADNPRLLIRSADRRRARERAGRPADPLKVTLTSSGDLDPGAAFFTAGDGPKLVYVPEGGIAHRVPAPATVVVAAGLPAVLADLAGRGVGRLLVEGGTAVHTTFLASGLADELSLAIAPILVGGGTRFVDPAGFPPERLRLLGVEAVGDMAVLRYGRA